MYALNFYSDVYEDILKSNRKNATIRLGDKSHKYKPGMIVWVTVGPKFSKRQKLYAAILDRVEVKPISTLTTRDIRAENPELRSHEDILCTLSRAYHGEFITPHHLITIVYFSKIDE